MLRVLVTYMACFAVVASADSFDENVDEYSWVSSTTLGLQRSFTVTKKPLEATQKKGLEGSNGEKQKEGLGDDAAIALGLEIDESAPTWLADATTLGLQRGFKVAKKVTNTMPSVPEAPVPFGKAAAGIFQVLKKDVMSQESSPDPSWKDFTTLGLQRGFKIQKKAIAHPEATEEEQLAQPLLHDASVLGLQRAFHVAKKPLTASGDAAKLSSPSLQESSVLGLQRRFDMKKVHAPAEPPTSSLLTSTREFLHGIELQNATKLELNATNLTAPSNLLDMTVLVV